MDEGDLAAPATASTTDMETTSSPLPAEKSIWLRGDEPYFAEFSLTPEEVMAQLAIKRSRLRQLSGHELRVGRKKVERFIRPFYRQEDVDAYQQATRATATHQRSSEAITAAATSLAAENARVTAEMTQMTEAILGALGQNTNTIQQQTGAVVAQAVAELTRTTQALALNLRSQLAAHECLLARQQASLTAAQQESLASLNALQKGQERLADGLVESLAWNQSNHQRLLQLESSLTQIAENARKPDPINPHRNPGQGPRLKPTRAQAQTPVPHPRRWRWRQGRAFSASAFTR